MSTQWTGRNQDAGRQVERLATLRKAAELTWERHAQHRNPGIDFETLFHDTLTAFDTVPQSFSTARFQDELLGSMAEVLDVDYNTPEEPLERDAKHTADEIC